MYNNTNNSIYELVDNDLFVNYIMDQPQQQEYSQLSNQFHRTNSNQNFQGFNQYPLLDHYEYQNDIKQEDDQKIKKQKPKRKSSGAKRSAGDDSGLLQKNNDLFTYKNNLKNTYINKITSLLSSEQVKNTSKSIQSQKINKNKQYEDEKPLERKSSSMNEQIEDSAQAKLLRNRECARNSRKRKKIYIELLENRVKFLNEELEKYKRIIKTSANYLSKMSQNQQLQGFFLGRQQLFEKLEKAISNNADSNELNLLLDSMRFRVGGGGKERVNASNYFFNQILEICFPVHVRYMLWSAAESKDLFAESNEEFDPLGYASWTQDIQKEMEVTEQQKKQMKKSQRRIIADKNKLQEILTQFQDVKEQLYAKTSQVENFIDELRNILSPMQVAKFLIGLENNKFRKEMTIQKIWDFLDLQSDHEMDIKEEDSFDEDQQYKKVHI